MKKLVVFYLLCCVLSSMAYNHKPRREARRVKILIEKVNFKLDSLIQMEPYEVIKGRRYYRFCGGVLTPNSDTTIMGAFGGLDRIHFTSHNGEIMFSEIDETGRCYEKTLEQLLFALGKEW